MTPRLLSVLAAIAAVSLTSCTSRDDAAGPAAAASSGAAGPPSAAPARCVARSPARIAPAATPGASSAVELVRAGDRVVALVADHDERALHAVDLGSMQQIGVTPLPGRPGHVLALGGGLVAVTLHDAGRVVVLEPADDALAQPFEERCAATVAAEPWSLAQAGDRLLVGSGSGAALSVLRAADLGVERVVRLPREPRAVLVANGGGTAFVAHAVGGIVSAVDLEDPSKPPEPIRLQAGRRATLDHGWGAFDDKRPREASQGYALARVAGARRGGERDALRLFAPHTSVDPGAPEGGASGGYGGGPGPRVIASIVSVIDPLARRSITSHVAHTFHDPFAPDCLLPRGAVADEGSLFVACLDLDAVLDLDPWLGDPIVGERRRVALPAGPSALTLTADGAALAVWSELDRALSRVERETFAIRSVPLWRRAGEPRDARLERGRRLFHTSRDARIASARACASCHPEGRDDGLVWTSPDGLRQTIQLAGRLDGTGPYGWFGESSTVRAHVQKTFARVGGTGLEDPRAADDFDALLAYVASLPPPPASPPADASAAERGKAVFVSYHCDDCHKGGPGTDGLTHDVGSGVEGERSKAFDTPSLRGVGGSAPYFHDGRYATLEELLSAKDSRMFTGNLSEADRKDLITYLETL
jgi:cytochrome c553